MAAFFDHYHLHTATLILLTAVACGGRSSDGTDGGVGGAAASGGTSNTGGSSGSGANGGNGGVSTGGTGGTGGSSGSGGTGGVITGDSGTCGCTAGHVGWGMNGGNGLYQESSALEICNLFVHRRTPLTPSPPSLSCEQPINDCAGNSARGT